MLKYLCLLPIGSLLLVPTGLVPIEFATLLIGIWGGVVLLTLYITLPLCVLWAVGCACYFLLAAIFSRMGSAASHVLLHFSKPRPSKEPIFREQPQEIPDPMSSKRKIASASVKSICALLYALGYVFPRDFRELNWDLATSELKKDILALVRSKKSKVLRCWLVVCLIIRGGLLIVESCRVFAFSKAGKSLAPLFQFFSRK